jgi:hypothetical protein
MSHRFSLAAALMLFATACTHQENQAPETYEPEPPAPGTWFQPEAGATWQWQIEGTLNTAYDAEVYDIDAFENDAATIEALHASGRKVVCYFSAGTYEQWRDDAADYPAQVIGLPLEDWPDERWVDIRSSVVRSILAKRMDLAAQKGCDGVEPDNVTAWRNESGFDITAEDQLDFNRWLADEAHARGMGAALKNDGDQATELAAWFDFSVNEECHFYDECAQLEPFFAAGKPVFNAEYANSAAEAEALAPDLCPKALAAGTRTLILPWDLDDIFRVSCDE